MLATDFSAVAADSCSAFHPASKANSTRRLQTTNEASHLMGSLFEEVMPLVTARDALIKPTRI